jgi:DNA-directed RNA polymerase subunit RPC12/RpoP
MTDDAHVDGNSLGGVLMEVFGREMTDTRGCCATCGSVNPLGAMLVYRSAGDVVRCPTCGNVVVVVATIHQRTRIHLAGVSWLEPNEAERGS